MKAKALDSRFSPVSIEIIFESQEELDNFGCLFNTVPFCEDICVELNIDHWAIKDACREAGSNTGGRCTEIAAIIRGLK